MQPAFTDVSHFALGAALFFRELSHDRQGVRELCLAAAELAVDFVDAA